MKQYDIIVVGTGGATIVADAAQKKGLKEHQQKEHLIKQVHWPHLAHKEQSKYQYSNL